MAMAREQRHLDTPATEQDLVTLDRDHPGFRDPIYRARRNEIAAIALSYRHGDPIPRISYTEDEHAVWSTVWRRLAPMHARFASRAFLDGVGKLALDHQKIPQLADVNPVLQGLTGFRMVPVAGLVASRAFLGHLGESMFLSTQYIRHASRPLYTPEPDVVHELIGHASSFCNPVLAQINRLFGSVVRRASDEAVVELERLYWFTVEFGVVREDEKPRAYGAGLLSSFGELGRFVTDAFLEPFDPDEVVKTPYDPTDYQKTLFVVPSLEGLLTTLQRFLGARY
jgi:phenylalanine-4-hydroxylase